MSLPGFMWGFGIGWMLGGNPLWGVAVGLPFAMMFAD